MRAKVYVSTLLVAGVAAGVLIGTGIVSGLALTAIGFLFATLVFLGIVGVPPSWIDKHYSWDYQERAV